MPWRKTSDKVIFEPVIMNDGLIYRCMYCMLHLVLKATWVEHIVGLVQDYSNSIAKCTEVTAVLQ